MGMKEVWRPHCYHPLHLLSSIVSRLLRSLAIIMNGKEVKHCSLCFHNGEPEEFYSSHNLKTRDGRVVTCPVLRKFVCNICGATGDVAHTLRYCPLNKDGAFSYGASLPQLKTRRNAAGNFSSRRMFCHPLPSSCRAQDDVHAEVMKLKAEASSLPEGNFCTNPPLAMRTFVGKARQPGVDKLAHRGCVDTQSYNYSGVPQGSFSRGMSMERSDLHLVPSRHGATEHFSYINMYPLKSKVEYGPLGMKGQAGWGAAILNDRLEEDVGRLLAELRYGTTAVDMI